MAATDSPRDRVPTTAPAVAPAARVRRYEPRRWRLENGGRELWLENGARAAATINAARAGDFDSVLAAVRRMGGVSPRGGVQIARDIVRAAAKLAEPARGHRVAQIGDEMCVVAPAISWQYRGRSRRQFGVVGETVLWSVRRPAAIAAK